MGTTSKHLSRQPRPRDALSTKASVQWVTILDAPRTIWQSKLGTTFPLSMSRDWNVKLCSSELCCPYFDGELGLRQNSGTDRPGLILTYGWVWITCVFVWIGGMDRPVGSGYGSVCTFWLAAVNYQYVGWTHPIVSWACSVLIKA